MTTPITFIGGATGLPITVYPRTSSGGGGGGGTGFTDILDKLGLSKPSSGSTTAPKWEFAPNQFDQAPIYDFGTASQWTMNPQIEPWMMAPVQTGMPTEPQSTEMNWMAGTPSVSIRPAPPVPVKPPFTPDKPSSSSSLSDWFKKLIENRRSGTSSTPTRTPTPTQIQTHFQSLLDGWRTGDRTPQFDLSSIQNLLGQWASDR